MTLQPITDVPARTEAVAGLLHVALEVEQRERSGHLGVAARRGGRSVLAPDRDGLEDRHGPDQADGDADQDLDQRQAARWAARTKDCARLHDVQLM